MVIAGFLPTVCVACFWPIGGSVLPKNLPRNHPPLSRFNGCSAALLADLSHAAHSTMIADGLVPQQQFSVASFEGKTLKNQVKVFGSYAIVG